MAYKYTSYIMDKDTKNFLPISKPVSPEGESYDDMKNVPIINAYGASQFNCVNISELDCGLYNLYGYYKLSADSEIKRIENDFILVRVTIDINTNEKVAKYDVIEGGIVYTNIITYYDDNSVKNIIKSTNNIYWKEIAK